MSVSSGLEAPVEETYHYEREPGEPVSEAIVTAVSEFSDRPVVTPQIGASDEDADVLPPLYDYVDTDALDALVTGRRGADAGFSVTFTYGAYLVTVRKWVVTVTRSD
jgi:hypothetical protein